MITSSPISLRPANTDDEAQIKKMVHAARL